MIKDTMDKQLHSAYITHTEEWKYYQIDCPYNKNLVAVQPGIHHYSLLGILIHQYLSTQQCVLVFLTDKELMNYHHMQAGNSRHLHLLFLKKVSMMIHHTLLVFIIHLLSHYDLTKCDKIHSSCMHRDFFCSSKKSHYIIYNWKEEQFLCKKVLHCVSRQLPRLLTPASRM